MIRFGTMLGSKSTMQYVCACWEGMAISADDCCHLLYILLRALLEHRNLRDFLK